MAKFITGKDLEDAIYDIIWEAERKLLIVSPFIKLDDYFEKLFEKHINNPKLHLLIVFGKNESDVQKSLSKSDFDYFIKFPNVTIVYVPYLHAKYYANERKGVITSINLYDYSFKNNIEFGVYTELNMLSGFTKSPDNDAWNTCIELAESNEVIFAKRPVFEKSFLSSFLGKKYVKSDILHDLTKQFYSSWNPFRKNATPKTLSDFPEELENANQPLKPTREELKKDHIGYCIRTGIEIPFNIEKPLSYDAFLVWSRFGDPEFPENYCHYSGEKSNGETCVARPVLYKNWSKVNSNSNR